LDHREKGFISDGLFFRLIGFDEIRSLDVSDFEVADYLFDLNQTGILDVIGEPFDFVVEFGTVEHVFHMPNALRNMFEATKVGGYISLCTPTNNAMNHGFYQISPTLYDDYFRANGFEIIRMQVMRDTIRDGQIDDKEYEVWDYDPSDMGMDSPMDGKIYSAHALVKKTAESTFDRVPQQFEYARKWKAFGKDLASSSEDPVKDLT